MCKRFVLLKHENKGDFHVDFLLDCGSDRLLTWQINDKFLANFLTCGEKFFDFTKSSNHTNNTVYSNCQRIFDHRLKYFDFSGDLGEYRGYVTRLEYGIWELSELTGSRLAIKTVGTRLADNLLISRLWLFVPLGEMTMDIKAEKPDQLMQQLPPPGNGKWVVSCSFLC